MTAPLYDASIPVFRHGLAVLASLLDKGVDHALARGADPDALLDLRLAPDMLPLVGQVQRASDHAKGASARLAGIEPPPFADDERTLAEAHDRIARTLAYIDTVPAAAFAQAASRTITLPFDVPSLPAPRYLHLFALPSFQFHVTTAYAILRHHGVPLGKNDFIGDVR